MAHPHADHSSATFFAGEKRLPALAVCEHFAGNQTLISKAFSLQAEMGPVFDVTCDCEDGALAGEEREHATMVARAIGSDATTFMAGQARAPRPGHLQVTSGACCKQLFAAEQSCRRT